MTKVDIFAFKNAIRKYIPEYNAGKKYFHHETPK